MARHRDRSLPVGRGPHTRFTRLPGALLILGCGSSRTMPDAIPVTVDAVALDSQDPMAVTPNLDARIGLGGGASCDASAQCLSGGCTLGVCSDWTHVMKIGIDTTSVGADVREDVTEFPLLIRLDDMNFAFGEARLDGADIRFLDSSGNSLAHEIERWDAQKAAADIWVLVPRIKGNSRDNVIRMYWGNPLSTPTSSGPSVFGSYFCVFHMGGDPNNSTIQFDDDSGHDNAATVQSHPGTDLSGTGITGSGLALDGSSTLTTSRRLAAPQTMTVSLWLKTSTSTGGGIAGFTSNPSGDVVRHDRAVVMDSSGRISFAVLNGGVPTTLTSLANYNDGKWHFIVARFSNSGQYLFVDGESVADDPMLTSADAYSGYWRFGEVPALSPLEDDAGAPITISDFISGTIDETLVRTDELSDAWIKLSYATQRQGATAVVYPPR